MRQSDRPVIRNFVTVIGEQSLVSEAELETVVPTSLRESREQRGGDEASTPSDGPQRPARTRPGSSPDGLLPRPALAPLSCAKSAPSPSHRMRVRVPSGQTAEPLSLRLLCAAPGCVCSSPSGPAVYFPSSSGSSFAPLTQARSLSEGLQGDQRWTVLLSGAVRPRPALGHPSMRGGGAVWGSPPAPHALTQHTDCPGGEVEGAGFLSSLLPPQEDLRCPPHPH